MRGGSGRPWRRLQTAVARTRGRALGVLGALLWLRGCPLAWALPLAPQLGAHSLRVNITITPKIQRWCEAEVEVRGEHCFSYDCQSHKVRPVCVQRIKLEVELGEKLKEILKDLTEEFRRKLLDVIPNKFQGRGPLSLQALMVIQEEASGRSQGSWQFVISGQISLRLDLVTGNWTVDRPRDRRILEKWKEDRNMNATLWRISHGDWKKWLQHVAAHWEALETTAPLSTTLGRSATSIMQGPRFIFVCIIFTCVILPGIIGFVICKKCCKEHWKVWVSGHFSSWAKFLSPAACPDPRSFSPTANFGHLLRGADTEEATVSTFLAGGPETSCRGGGGRGIEKGGEEHRGLR